MEEEESAEGGHAAAAFESLRAEVAAVREDIEALQRALSEHQGPDLTPTLAQIAKAQHIAAQHLGVIQQHPALRMTPEQHGQAIVNAGRAVMGEAVRDLRDASADVRHAGQQLGVVIGTVREQRRHLESLAWTAGIALLIGLLLSPFFAGGLPFGWDGAVAASILHQDRWNAGATLMASANPDAWRELQSAEEFMRANRETLAACHDVAAKTKKVQRCAISISTPE